MMRGILIASGLAVAAGLVAAPAARACDSTGCLLLTRGQNGVQAKGSWRVDLSFRDTDEPDALQGSRSTTLALRPKVYFEQQRLVPAFHLDRNARERFLQVDVGYGLSDHTSLYASIPAATQRVEDVAHGAIDTSYDVRGLGDALFGVRQALALHGALVGGLAVKAPLARHTLIDQYDGTILEPTQQPGSGAWSVLSSLQYSVSGLLPDVSWTASLSQEVTTASAQEYRFGNESIATLGASRPLGSVLSASLQAKMFYKARSTYRGAEVDSTGTTVAYVTPGLRVRGPSRMGAYAFFQVPVYRYVHETQLAPRYGWLVGINRSF